MAQRVGAWSGVPTQPRLSHVGHHTGVPHSAPGLLRGGFNRHDGPLFLAPFRALAQAAERTMVRYDAESGGGGTGTGTGV